jgi:hypothetical protein
MLVTSNRLVPASADAITVWPFIFVRPAARADRALIEHELVHYREQARCAVAGVLGALTAIVLSLAMGGHPSWTEPAPRLAGLAPFAFLPWSWWGFYVLSPKFRLRAEVRAYRRQIELGGLRVDQAAQLIATRYFLRITAERAGELLRAP